MVLLVLPEQLVVLVFKVSRVLQVLLVLLELAGVVVVQLSQVQKYFLGIVPIQYRITMVDQILL